jgi:hypothetical protein
VNFETLSVAWGPTPFVWTWVASAFVMVASSLLFWVDWAFYFRSEASWVILPSLGLAFSSVTAQAI